MPRKKRTGQGGTEEQVDFCPLINGDCQGQRCPLWTKVPVVVKDDAGGVVEQRTFAGCFLRVWPDFTRQQIAQGETLIDAINKERTEQFQMGEAKVAAAENLMQAVNTEARALQMAGLVASHPRRERIINQQEEN